MNEKIDKSSAKQMNYDAASIQVLEGLEAVRKRPAMYIGDIGSKGLHHLVYEVVDNSIDEAMGGYCTQIDTIINEDGSVTIADNGRGIPVDIHEKEGRSALEVVMTVLHAGGKFNKDTYKVSGGLHGVGVSCVNALAINLKVTVRRDGKVYQQEYSQGKPLYKVKEIGVTDRTGTEVTFTPDKSIFPVIDFNYEILSNRLKELSFLNKGVRLTIIDKRKKNAEDGEEPVMESFYSDEGLKEFVQYLDETREKLIEEPIYMDGEKSGVPVEVAMQYNSSFAENVQSYVNNINTIEGGSHMAGFRRALTRTLKSYAEKS
ncbi:MAG: ATP-binding protein, partial [Bacteroidota bacterium]